MVENRAVAIREPFTKDELAIIKRTVAAKTNDDQFRLFIQVCKYSGLNPFARQIYAVVRGNELSIQTGIDGYRLLAERSGNYLGQLGPQWCGPDGVWVDVWLKDEPPTACKVGVLRRGFEQPIWGVAKYKAFFMQSNPLWTKMPDHMLSIRAEALALRKAFPSEMTGIYTKEEMEQAEYDHMPLPSVHVESVAHDASVETVTGEVVEDSRQETRPEKKEDPRVARLATIGKTAREKGLIPQNARLSDVMLFAGDVIGQPLSKIGQVTPEIFEQVEAYVKNAQMQSLSA